MKRNEARPPALRELYVEELVEVTGGADPLEKVRRALEDYLTTTYGCGEEIISPC
ncbi:MAG TPA: hypothetical protein VHI71_07475 [Actinomycetota bacterium]|nr:hypothetical protein [Actinomycetota bacterium]